MLLQKRKWLSEAPDYGLRPSYPAGSGFAMTPEEFAALYPVVLSWIRQTLADHEPSAKTVASQAVKRLRSYFSQELLDTAKAVSVARVPVPPLSSMGLERFNGQTLYPAPTELTPHAVRLMFCGM